MSNCSYIACTARDGHNHGSILPDGNEAVHDGRNLDDFLSASGPPPAPKLQAGVRSGWPSTSPIQHQQQPHVDSGATAAPQRKFVDEGKLRKVVCMNVLIALLLVRTRPS